MSSHDIPVLTLLFVLALAGTAGATYAADRPITTTFSGELTGDYLYSMGNSYYSSTLDPGATYNVTFDVRIPDDATVTFQRLYVYWGWSRINQQAIYPVISLRDSRMPSENLTLISRYSDSKGFASKYDFYSGMDSYQMIPLAPGKNQVTVTVHQDGPPNSSILCFGMAVLAVFQSPAGPRSMIWVKEGSDLMYSSYGVSPEMASSELMFDGALPRGKIESAELFLVAPSGGYSRDLEVDINSLMVNRLEEEKTPPLIRTIFSLLFPNYRGKEWSDIFNLENATQIGFETKEIKPYLKTENNRVTVRDQGDYFQLTNAILALQYSGDHA